MASLLLQLAAPCIAAGEAVPGQMSDAMLREQEFEPLVEEASLDAWDLKPWHQGHWTIRDGVIDYDGRAEHKQAEKNSLWTKRPYADIMLYAEWRLPAAPRMKPQPIVLFNGDFLLDESGRRVTRPGLDAGDSGLLFRGTAKCQANIWCQDLGSGEINGYRTERRMPPDVRRACIPLTKADRSPGAWNVFVIRLHGERMTVELNGQRVIDAAQLPGLPESGPIGLQHHGDRVQFRRIWVKEIN
jgi:hypothetical protein